MTRTVPPILPDWLIDAAAKLPPDVRGVALGFAASGYVAGHEDGWHAGFDAALAARREVDAAHAKAAGLPEGEAS